MFQIHPYIVNLTSKYLKTVYLIVRYVGIFVASGITAKISQNSLLVLCWWTVGDGTESRAL